MAVRVHGQSHGRAVLHPARFPRCLLLYHLLRHLDQEDSATGGGKRKRKATGFVKAQGMKLLHDHIANPDSFSQRFF